MISDDEAFVEVELGYQTVQGKISVKLDEAITFDTSYQYDPADDPNRFPNRVSSIGIDEYDFDESFGVVHPVDEYFSLTGSSVSGTHFDFSLFMLRSKVSKYNPGFKSKVWDKFDFGYFLNGAKAQYNEKIFDEAIFWFDDLNKSILFAEAAIKVIEAKIGDSGSNRIFDLSDSNTLWSIKLSDGATLSLGLVLPVTTNASVVSIRKELRFAIERSKESNFSIEELLTKYIEPIRRLLEISFGETVNFPQLAVRKSGDDHHSFLGKVKEKYSEKIPSHLSSRMLKKTSSFNAEKLTPEDYRNWLEKYPDTEYFCNLLARSLEPNFDDILLGRMVTQLESLYRLVSRDGTPAKDFGKQVGSLLSNQVGTKTRLGKINCQKVSKRIKALRTLLTHKVLNELPKVGMEEMHVLSMVVKQIYLSSIMDFSGIDYLNKIYDSNSFEEIERRESFEERYSKLGYEKWSKLDELIAESQEYSIGN